MSYPTEFVDSTQNHNKSTTITNRKFTRKNYVKYFKSENELKICVVATRRILQVRPKILKKLSDHQIN
jgi:diphthamide synthase subunit DPH2